VSLFVLDSDILDLYQTGHPAVVARLHSHALEELATTVITVEEHLSGWYTLVRRVKDAERLAGAYQRLADSVVFLSRFRILSLTLAAIERYEELKRLKLGTKKMDLRIAAITLVYGGTLVTRNVRDFNGSGRKNAVSFGRGADGRGTWLDWPGM
jgi:predicted nucleic acid-binding protein